MAKQIATNNTELAAQLTSTLNGLPAANPKPTQPFDMGDNQAQTTKETFEKKEEEIKAPLDVNYFLYDEENSYVYELPIPGLDKENVKIDLVDDSMLTVEINENNGYDLGRQLLIGPKDGSDTVLNHVLNGVAGFSSQIPPSADPEKIEPIIGNGLLRIKIAKKKIKKKSIKIL